MSAHRCADMHVSVLIMCATAGVCVSTFMRVADGCGCAGEWYLLPCMDSVMRDPSGVSLSLKLLWQ